MKLGSPPVFLLVTKSDYHLINDAYSSDLNTGSPAVHDALEYAIGTEILKSFSVFLRYVELRGCFLVSDE